MHALGKTGGADSELAVPVRAARPDRAVVGQCQRVIAGHDRHDPLRKAVDRDRPGMTTWLVGANPKLTFVVAAPSPELSVDQRQAV